MLDDYARLIVKLLILISLMNGTAAVMLPCTDHVQEQGGPGGFGTSYLKGNRVTVNKFQARTRFEHIPDDLEHKVHLFLNHEHIRVGAFPGRRKLSRYHIMLKNEDTVVRHAQLAWFADLEDDPLIMFTFEAPAESAIEGCVDVMSTFDSSPLTLQAF